MSFKRILKKLIVIFLSLSLAGLSACSDFLHEKRQEPQTIELSNERFACLKSLPDKMSQYMEGKVAPEDIRNGFDCGKEALVYFKSKTRGSLPEAYTLEDIRNFFGKYFLKENNVSPEFAAQLFKLKKVILGGEESSITKAELEKMVRLLDLLKEQAVLLSPHFSILIGRATAPTWKDIDAATEQLGKTLWAVFRQVELARSDYSFKDFKKFIEGLNNFINTTQSLDLYEKAQNNFELIEAVKQLVIGDQSRFDNLKDWKDALNTVLLLYKEFLRYNYFIQGNSLNNAQDSETLMNFIEDGFHLLHESLPLKNHGGISFKTIDHVLEVLESRKLLPANLTAKSIKETYKKIVLRLLDPRRQGDARGLEQLEKAHLAVLILEWKSYRLHQHFINSLSWAGGNLLSKVELQKAIDRFDAPSYIASELSWNSLEQEVLRNSWLNGLQLLQNNWAVVFNEKGRLQIQSQVDSLGQSWSSLTRWNLMRAVSRALTLAYGPKELEVQDMERLYDDFQSIGQELKAFDPRSGNAGTRSFNEANFFTFAGNGDARMDAQESFEFISLLVSGGMNSANSIQADMLQRGCGLSETDIFGFPWLNEVCFKQQLRAESSRYFDNLPGLVGQISKMSAEQWNEFYGNLMSAARISSPQGGRVEVADLRTAVMMLHYTEILMSVYDLNQNGTLEREEIELAAPRFLAFMKTVSPINADFVVSDFFLYLVFTGKKPALTDYDLTFQVKKLFNSLGGVSRDKILRVFKVLKDEAAKK